MKLNIDNESIVQTDRGYHHNAPRIGAVGGTGNYPNINSYAGGGVRSIPVTASNGAISNRNNNNHHHVSSNNSVNNGLEHNHNAGGYNNLRIRRA